MFSPNLTTDRNTGEASRTGLTYQPGRATSSNSSGDASPRRTATHEVSSPACDHGGCRWNRSGSRRGAGPSPIHRPHDPTSSRCGVKFGRTPGGIIFRVVVRRSRAARSGSRRHRRPKQGNPSFCNKHDWNRALCITRQGHDWALRSRGEAAEAAPSGDLPRKEQGTGEVPKVRSRRDLCIPAVKRLALSAPWACDRVRRLNELCRELSASANGQTPAGSADTLSHTEACYYLPSPQCTVAHRPAPARRTHSDDARPQDCVRSMQLHSRGADT